MYRISNESIPLDYLRVDVDEVTRNLHPSMVAQARDAANVRNRVIDLLQGKGDYADAWSQPELLTDADGNPVGQAPYDPGITAPLVDSLCFEVRGKTSYSYPLDAQIVRARVEQIAAIDPGHPIARNWAVLRDACYLYGTYRPDWTGDVAG